MANKSQQDLAQAWATALRNALKGVTVARGKQLPEDFVTIAKGEMMVPKTAGAKPKGGGAGPGGKPHKPHY
jgi:hypothetical protein